MTSTEMIDKIFQLSEKQFRGISWPIFLVSAALVCVVIFLIATIIRMVSGRAVSKITIISYMFLCVYLCFVFQITFFNREVGSRMGIRFSGLTLFKKNGWGVQKVYDLLNMVLFFPFGFWIAIIKKYQTIFMRLVMIVIYSLLGSMIIETAQFVTARGYLEVPDLLANTIGGIIGGLVGLLVVEAYRSIKSYAEGGIYADEE